MQFQKQDRRSYTLITPCKRSVARGKKTTLSLPELRSSSTHYGVPGLELCP